MRGMPEIRKAWPNGSQTDARKSRHWKTRIESANAARQNISTSIVDIVAIVESSLPLLPAYLSTGSSGKRSQLKRNQRKKKNPNKTIWRLEFICFIIYIVPVQSLNSHTKLYNFKSWLYNNHLFNRLSHDVVTWVVDRDVSTAYLVWESFN